MVTIAVNERPDWSRAAWNWGAVPVGGWEADWGSRIGLICVFNHMVELPSQTPILPPSLSLSLTRRHTDWLIRRLTHLVNRYVSHFKSYVHNDMLCVSVSKEGRGGSNVKGGERIEAPNVCCWLATQKTAPGDICANSNPRMPRGARVSETSLAEKCKMLPPCSHLANLKQFVWGSVCRLSGVSGSAGSLWIKSV